MLESTYDSFIVVPAFGCIGSHWCLCWCPALYLTITGALFILVLAVLRFFGLSSLCNSDHMESRPHNMGKLHVYLISKEKESCVWTVVYLQGLSMYLVYELWFERFGPFKLQEGEKKLGKMASELSVVRN